MIGLLAEVGPMPVNELSARVAMSQPLISWHLRILRLAGLVDTERQGRTTICRLRTAAFEELHDAEGRLVGGTAGVAHPAAVPGDGAGCPLAASMPASCDGAHRSCPTGSRTPREESWRRS